MRPVQLRPLGFDEILDGAFALYRRHFVTLFLTALLPLAPMSIAMAVWLTNFARFDPSAPMGFEDAGLLFVGSVVSMFGAALAFGALTWQFSRAYLGEAVTIRDAYGQGLRAMLPLIVAMFLLIIVGSIVFTILAVALTVFLAVLPLGRTAGGVLAGVIAVFVGFVLAVIAFAASFAVVPAIVVERVGPIRALRRSWSLSRGAWLRIIGVLLIGLVITMLPTMGVTAAAGMLDTMFSATAAAAMTTTQIYFQQAVGLLTSAATFPFVAGSLLLLYYDRRIRKEGFDLELATQALGVEEPS